jgi:hypothetical protein
MDFNRIADDLVTAGLLGLGGLLLRRIRRLFNRLSECESDIAKICRIPGVAEEIEEINRVDRIFQRKGWLDE